ncbi:MAG: hypothetical protein R3B90_23555 [Planctomycetaceae bacterium]
MLTRPRSFLALLLVVCCGQHLSADDAARTKSSEVEESWQITALQGQKIGYSQNRSWSELRDGQTVYVTDVHMHSVLKRFGGKVTMIIDQRIEEAEDGTLLGFTLTMDNPPSSKITTKGTVNGDELTLEITSAQQTVVSRQAVPRGVKSSSYPDRITRSNPPATGESQTYLIYDPQLSLAANIKVTEGRRSLSDSRRRAAAGLAGDDRVPGWRPRPEDQHLAQLRR